jgi:NTP pyrophosphatase (non-canonical NTP hydrolase)
MWLFTFAGKIQGPFEIAEGTNMRIGESTIKTQKNFSEIAWNKYPGVCPVCFWRRYKNGETAPAKMKKPCDCLIFNVEDRDKVNTDKEKKKKAAEKLDRVKKLRNYARVNSGEKPNSIDEWQENFRKLYLANLMHTSLVDIAFHLLEEVGEVSDAMVRMYTYTGDLDSMPKLNQVWLEEEIADVFSWLLTLVNSLQIMPDIAKGFLEYLDVNKLKFSDEKIMLSKILWHRYGSDDNQAFWCPICKKLKCKCEIILIGENKGYGYDKFLEHVGFDPFV